MKTLLSDYEQRVFNLVDGMKVNDRIEVSKWTKEETRNDFISSIKKRIDIRGDCEFNADYTKFKKIGTWEEIEDKWSNCDSKIYKELNKQATIVKPTEQTEDVWAKIKRK